MLNALAKKIPWLLGGAADLSGSTKVTIKGEPNLAAGEPGGRNIYYGVREHAMGAIVNGMVLTKLRAFGSTFLTFTDYMRAPIRLSSLMEIPVFHVMTHDSIGLGEDGPTHQPIEQLASLRGDARVVGHPSGRRERGDRVLPAGDGEQAPPGHPQLQPAGPPHLRPDEVRACERSAEGRLRPRRRRGRQARVLLMATGSEVRLIVEAYEKLKAEGIRARAISMPCWEIFEQQSPEYRESVFPSSVNARVAVEQAATFGWEAYVGRTGKILGMRSFGASAPLKDLLQHFGFTTDHVVAAAKEQLGKK